MTDIGASANELSSSTQKNLHKELCGVAVKWLKRPKSAGGHGCAVALSECRTGYDGEIPDAIGFRQTGYPATDGSVVVEVKVSRADFLADAKKPHRIAGGIGSWRYYLAPQGLIRVDELPSGWGLLELTARGSVKALAGYATHCKARDSEYVRQACIWRFPDVDLQREQFLLVRALANTGDPQKVLGMLREANNRAARRASEIERIGKALGLPQYTAAHQIESQAVRMRKRLERLKEVEATLQPLL